MLRMKRQGFTLIELMVVIVIIGVLASLAIPRFTEASAKAKAAEAPRVLASYESATLAALAELSQDLLDQTTKLPKLADLVFEGPKDSKWWKYETAAGATSFTATANATMGPIGQTSSIFTYYNTAQGADCFFHGGTIGETTAKKMFPNFLQGGTGSCSTFK